MICDRAVSHYAASACRTDWPSSGTIRAKMILNQAFPGDHIHRRTHADWLGLR